MTRTGGFRLPTEAEWEYAARNAGTSSKFSGTGDSTTLSDYAWYSNNSGGKTHAVGTKLANGLGLYDMAGNVFEWCWDIYQDYTADTQVNPTGAATGTTRIMRGGAWNVGSYYCRTTYRMDDIPAGILYGSWGRNPGFVA